MVDILGGASEALASSLSFLRGHIYGLTNCQKNLLAFGKNISLRSNYLFHHPKTSKLEIKGAKHKRF